MPDGVRCTRTLGLQRTHHNTLRQLLCRRPLVLVHLTFSSGDALAEGTCDVHSGSRVVTAVFVDGPQCVTCVSDTVVTSSRALVHWSNERVLPARCLRKHERIVCKRASSLSLRHWMCQLVPCAEDLLMGFALVLFVLPVRLVPLETRGFVGHSESRILPWPAT